MTESPIHPADTDAISRVLEVEPVWLGLRPAAEAVGLDRQTLLHAGPAFTDPGAICRPVLNSAVVAAVYEGLAPDFEQAERMILGGDVTLRPAQDYGVVTPLAAVVSASMNLQVVADMRHDSRVAHAPINGGSGPAPRLGLRTPEALEHIRWLNGPLAEVLARALEEPIRLIPLARQGLEGGDDGHGRTPVATAALAGLIAPRFGPGETADRARTFLDQGPSFFLNLWMAACKCMLMAADGVAASGLVTAAGGNGVETGIGLAGLPGQWVAAAAEPPRGSIDDPALAGRALGAIGDSAIVDALGFGAMAMSFAPEQQKALMPFMPEGGLALPGLLLMSEHPAFHPLTLHVGLSARAVAATGRRPVVSLGILDRDGQAGRLGGGIYQPPQGLFEAALEALDAAT